MSGLRVRFAPSPTGSLHLGNARTALFNWLIARGGGGTVVLRIEDTDRERHVDGAEERIFDDLRWLGLDWDEGPDVGGQYGPYRQSERGEFYAAAAAKLVSSAAAYRCFCTDEVLESDREAARSRGETPRYRRHCAGIEATAADERAAAGEPFALRFDGVRAAGDLSEVVIRDRLHGDVRFEAAELGDAVIVRRDGRPTYNFAVVVDDAGMGIDLVLRGDDHLSNTPRQAQLFRALGAELPEFAHLPMVRGADGSRLSKRHGAVSVGEYRRRGYPAEGLLNALALLGWATGDDRTLLDRAALRAEFSLDRVGTSPSTFDRAKLDWLCGQHIQQLPADVLSGPVAAALQGAGLLPEQLPREAPAWLAELADLLRTYLEHYDQTPERAASLFFAGGDPGDDGAAAALLEPTAREVVAAIADLAANEPPLTAESWAALKTAVKQQSGAKGKALFHPLRAVLTGRLSGPELDRLVPLIERGHRLFPDRIATVATRAGATLEWIDAAPAAR